MSVNYILNNINFPEDIKNLSNEELNILCKEIREKIIEAVSKNGGHLSSNLGVVELSVALHKVFDSPKDKIVWDVGHQCYTHKVLTGRREKLKTIRKEGGISGFPRRNESEHDILNAGHSSTSISAAFGLCKSNELLGKNDKVIAVIGDGALSGGLAYEGLNNAGRYKKNFIVILNDNKMSISRNVGSIARYLMAMRSRSSYIKAKKKAERVLDKIPVIGKVIKKLLLKSKTALRNLVYQGTLFENMGFHYYGPIDGHNVEKLVEVLTIAKDISAPVLVHINTVKGKGYYFAEKNPKIFHGTSAFDIQTGGQKSSKGSFSEVFGKQLCLLAEQDKRICGITAAMELGTGLSSFAKNFKNRFFDVGIAEGHAVTFAGGLAAGGMIPVFAVYSTFLQRGYDQIIHDAALQGLKIVLAIDRAGIVGEDGETHQGVFDVSFLNSIPNMSIYAPSYFDEVGRMMKDAIYTQEGVCAVRYPRGGEGPKPKDFVSKGLDYDVYGTQDCKIALITYGRLFSEAIVAKEKLKRQGVDICIIKLNKIKPIDKGVVKIAKNFKMVYFFEEGMLIGGIGEHLSYLMQENGYKGEYQIIAIEDKFIEHASVASILHRLKLDSDGMVDIISKGVICE